MNSAIRSIILFSLATVSALNAAKSAPAKTKDRYWEWGVAVYGAQSTVDRPDAPTTDLDLARQDWISLVNSGPDKTTVPAFNRFLKINPNLKILVRLWPINGLTNRKENQHKATFLDYIYTPGVKENLLAKIKQQIDDTLIGLSNPDAVVGFHFLEELPYNFCGTEIGSIDPVNLSADLEYHRKSIESERGKPLVWDEESREWWAEKWVMVQNEINAYIKEQSGGKPVFVYYQTNTRLKDFLGKGESINQPKTLGFEYSDVIKPGVADGFFAYPVNELVWKRFLDLSSRHNWPFFSQLSHPSGMRIESWEKTIELVKTRHPNNLGTFIYCEGHCMEGVWNDDPHIHPEDNANRLSITSHYRQILADLKVGTKLIEEAMKPALEVEYDVEKVGEGDYLKVSAAVYNRYDEAWHLPEDRATLRNAELHLELSDDYIFDPLVTAPAKLKIGDVPPRSVKRAYWYARSQKQAVISEESPLRLRLKADGREDEVAQWSAPSSILPPNLTRVFRRSGEYWPVSLFHIKIPIVFPLEVSLECIGDPCTNPSITASGKRTIYQGVLRKGDRLVIQSPAQTATLISENHPEGIDVSDRLASTGFVMAGYRVTPVEYADDDPPSIAEKLRISIVPKPQQSQ